MTLSLRDDVSVADTGTGLVLLDERAGTYFRTNATGALVVRRLIDGMDEQEVAALLCRRFAVEPERARTDVADLLRGLRAAGLLVAGAA